MRRLDTMNSGGEVGYFGLHPPLAKSKSPIRGPIMYRCALVILALVVGCQQEMPPSASAISEAQNLTAEGIAIWAYGSQEKDRSQYAHSADILEQALALDSTNALTYAYLPHSYFMMTFREEMDPVEAEEKARNAAAKALELDSNLAETHYADGLIKLVYDQDFEAAEKAFKHSIELNPDYSNSHREYSHLLIRSGRLEEAIAEAERALELDDKFPAAYGVLCQARRLKGQHNEVKRTAELASENGITVSALPACRMWSHIASGEYDIAMNIVEQNLTENPESSEFKNQKAVILGLEGRYEEALSLYEEVGNPGGRAIMHAHLGHEEEALSGIEEMKTLIEQGQWGWGWTVADTYHALGDKEEALSWYEQAFNVRAEQASKEALVEYIWWLVNSEQFESMREEPRIRAIIEKSGS